MKNSNKSLEQRIEESVAHGLREHIAILEKAAAEAVRRGVRRALGATSGTQRQQRRTTRKGLAPKQARRSTTELAALEEQLHAAICAQPGEKMTAYARAVESTPAKLNPSDVQLAFGRTHSERRPEGTRAVLSDGRVSGT